MFIRDFLFCFISFFLESLFVYSSRCSSVRRSVAICLDDGFVGFLASCRFRRRRRRRLGRFFSPRSGRLVVIVALSLRLICEIAVAIFFVVGSQERPASGEY